MARSSGAKALSLSALGGAVEGVSFSNLIYQTVCRKTSSAVFRWGPYFAPV